MNTRKLNLWLPILFAIVMVAGMFLGYKLRENTNTAGNFFQLEKKSPLQEVLEIVRLKYVDSINTDTLGEDAIKNMLLELDPHSVFIPAASFKDVNADLVGNFEGIGVEYALFKDTVNVISVIKGGPSDAAGIEVGDKFLEVEGRSIAGVKISFEDVRNYLRGESNTKVNVLIDRNGAKKSIDITRGRIPLPSLAASYLIEPEIGFIRLSKFSETTYEEFMYAMEALQKQGMKKLILDLRNNGGGLMNEAVDIADEFLDAEKLIVYTQGDKVTKHEYKSKRPGLFEKGSLVVLMDEHSASASEVLAGALQDWDRATIVGRRSFGKGLVQEQYRLTDGSALRITTARYYTPLGRSIQKPYTDGVNNYKQEIALRYQNGQMLAEDSTAHEPDEHFYTSKAGKKLYGGGGITPDVFVPIDTIPYSDYLTQLYYTNTISNFVYNYYIQNRTELDKLTNPLQLTTGALNVSSILAELNSFAIKDSIKVTPLSAEQEAELFRRVSGLLARQLWRNEGYFEVLNKNDKSVQKAVSILQNQP